MLASALLTKVRQNLSDTNKSRWTDERLLSLLNDGLSILTLDTILFMDKVYVELIKDLQDYDISNFAVRIVRAEYQGVPLSIVSHEMMDKLDAGWRTKTRSKFTHLMTDKARPGQYSLYPTVENLDNTLVDNVNGPYGIITDITYTDYQLQTTNDPGEIGTPEAAGWLLVYFTKKLDTITSLDDNIDTEDFVGVGLQHYITGRALRDNMDTQNRAVSAEEFTLWDALVEKYKIEKSKLYAQTGLTTSYRGGFN